MDMREAESYTCPLSFQGNASMLKDENIIFISDVSWDEHQVCEQNLPRRFAPCNRALYVERPVSFMTPFTKWGKGTTLKQLKRWFRRGIREEEGLLIASPPPFLPLRFTLLANIINQTIMITWLRRLIRRYDMADSIIITFEPYSARLRGKLEEKLFVYYCNDDHEAKNFWWNRRQSILKRERELLQKSDLVFCLTEGFATTRRPFNENMHIVPNAVDEKFIETCLAPAQSCPSDIARIKRPVIGFFGCIDSRLDVSLLRQIAGRRKDWSFVLIGLKWSSAGKLNGSFDDLCSMPNVHYLGGKPQAEVPSYIRAMDVCLIPSIVSDRTRNVLSIKLFEYTALGKAIVSTDLPELKRYDKYVKISHSIDEFHNNIDCCLKSWNDELGRSAVAFASQNTWRHRAEQMSRIIQSYVS